MEQTPPGPLELFPTFAQVQAGINQPSTDPQPPARVLGVTPVYSRQRESCLGEAGKQQDGRPAIFHGTKRRTNRAPSRAVLRGINPTEHDTTPHDMARPGTTRLQGSKS